MSTFNGLLAPKATPAAVIAKINQDSNAVLARKDVSDFMIASGALPMGGSPQDMERFLDKRADVLNKLITFANISFD
jgi:tripartite-type tricarboxylate transporter receptor subunit TctC